MKQFVSFMLCLLAFSPPRHQVTTSSMSGHVQDEQGAPVVGWGQLNTLDTSLLFLALLTGATALSWAILSRQRGALLSLLSGEDIPEPDLIPARLAVSALVVGSLSYFFLLSLETLCTARSQGAAACASAGRNARASLLVLAAALIRLYDLNILRCTAPALESEELPA